MINLRGWIVISLVCLCGPALHWRDHGRTDPHGKRRRRSKFGPPRNDHVFLWRERIRAMGSVRTLLSDGDAGTSSNRGNPVGHAIVFLKPIDFNVRAPVLCLKRFRNPHAVSRLVIPVNVDPF
jgi:hypothetical protein